MPIMESGEMYLETILVLSQKKSMVRAVDIAAYMGYSKPAVSRALNKLREENMIVTEEDGCIGLTQNGREAAERIYRKHTVLKEFIMRLGVDEETAAADACRIEHVISDKTFDAMLKFGK